MNLLLLCRKYNDIKILVSFKTLSPQVPSSLSIGITKFNNLQKIIKVFFSPTDMYKISSFKEPSSRTNRPIQTINKISVSNPPI